MLDLLSQGVRSSHPGFPDPVAPLAAGLLNFPGLPSQTLLAGVSFVFELLEPSPLELHVSFIP